MPVLVNIQHERFCREIACGVDVVEAYVNAGFKNARQNAHRMMTRDYIRQRIDELISDAAEAAGVTPARVIKELATIGFSDITEAVQWGEAVAVPIMARDGEMTGEYAVTQAVVLEPSKNLPKGVSRAIAEVRRTKEGIAIKMHSKTDALGKLATIFGMNKTPQHGDGNTINNTVNVQITANMTPQEMADAYVQLMKGV